MTESVTDVLQLRAEPEKGFSRSVMGSLVVHGLGIVALFLAHQYVVTHKSPAPKVMTITLGGSPGPRTTGSVAAGARPVDQVAPQPKHEPIRTAASKPDVMTLPVKSEPKKTPETVDRTLPITPVPKPPTIGPQIQKGTSLTETGSTSQSTGLTLGGGGGAGQNLLDVKDFCCPDYITLMLQRIENNWNKNVPGRGATVLRFVIHKDGSVSDITTESTTSTLLENNSRQAMMLARIPPLPAEFKDDHLVVHLRFPYGIQ